MTHTFESWTAEHVPDQSGKTVLITGANSGIGYFTARALAEAGAHVIVAGRDIDKVAQAIAKIDPQRVSGTLEAGLLDLASLASVNTFATDILGRHSTLDILVNNAGVMMPPAAQTEDGFEQQIGVNFIGHFALTGLLYDRLSQTPDARIVTLSSIAHRGGIIDFDNMKLEKPYDPKREYYQSKLADLMFALELGRRIDAKGHKLLSLACHPGFTTTELQRHLDPKFLEGMSFMDTWQGSLPTLMAATIAAPKQGSYYGPDGPGEFGGFPAIGAIDDAALDADTAQKLWDLGQSATGVRFP